MNKFTTFLSQTGSDVLKRRAENLSTETEETFEDRRRDLKKAIRQLENEIKNMEDLSVKSTESLIVGENLDTGKWVDRRIDLAYEKRDLEIRLSIINGLIEDYFAEKPKQ